MFEQAPNPFLTPPHLAQIGNVRICQDSIVFDGFSVSEPIGDAKQALLQFDWAIGRMLDARQALVPQSTGIDRYTSAIRTCLLTKNWFGALFLSLAMPDICGALENPAETVGSRYRKWFETYFSARFNNVVFSANECYLLRCALLHQGVTDNEKSDLDRIRFTTMSGGGIFHGNVSVVRTNHTSLAALQLQVDIFCEEICVAVAYWKFEMRDNLEVIDRMKDLLSIREVKDAFAP